MAARSLSDSTRSAIVAMRLRGMTIEEISFEVDRAPAVVWRVLRDRGMTRKRKVIPVDVRIQIAFEQDLTLKEMASKHCVSRASVARIRSQVRKGGVNE